MDTFNTLLINFDAVDYASLGLVALPIVAIILCGFLLVGKSKNDTMQRNGSKAGHNTKSHKDSQHSHLHHHHHHHSNMKNDSSDSGISTNGHPHHHHQQSSSAAKQRKSRSSSKRQDGGVEQQKRTTGGYSVDEWLGRDIVYCYERRYISSCAEDNMMPRHNPAHRNSTSSDAAASDDLNSSSSNEDLSAVYTVMSKTNKKSTKSRQKRQQKRKQQQQANNQQPHHHNSVATPMEIDEDSKENHLPTSVDRNHGTEPKNGTTGTNLRKQCTKAAALKAANTKHHNGNSNKSSIGNALSTSSSNSSVCSTLSAASSTSSIPSSVASSASSSPTNSANCSPTASPTVTKRNVETFKKIARALAPPLRQHTKLNLTESELIQHLRRYIIDPNLLRVYGYPIESAIHEGCIEIYKCLPKPFTTHHTHHQSTHNSTNVINTNDGLYANFSTASSMSAHVKQWGLGDANSSSADSGQGSGDSSPPSVDSDSSEVGEDEPTGTTAFYTPDGSYQIFSQYDQSLEKQCVRCKRAFHVTESGDYLSREECVFHWGKLNHMYTGNKGFGYSYSCCEGDQNSEGCTHNPLHVWTGAVVGLNGPYTDFVHTKPRYCPDGVKRRPEPRKVYALDCEMSFTGRGLEVTKVTVVGYDGQLVYEHFVRPQADIVDYNTRFSGITAKDLCAHSSNPNSVKTLAEVQRDLLQLFDADTILIGHGLDNDLRVLRIVHKTIIDTSIAFPHASGFPYRRALKHLTKVCLNRDIQCGDLGHSSFEDSRACLELMLWKVRKEMRHEVAQ